MGVAVAPAHTAQVLAAQVPAPCTGHTAPTSAVAVSIAQVPAVVGRTAQVEALAAAPVQALCIARIVRVPAVAVVQASVAAVQARVRVP